MEGSRHTFSKEQLTRVGTRCRYTLWHAPRYILPVQSSGQPTGLNSRKIPTNSCGRSIGVIQQVIWGTIILGSGLIHGKSMLKSILVNKDF